jgi:hypothetical protein
MFLKILLLYSSVNIGDVSHANALYASLAERVENISRYDIDTNKKFSTIEDEYKTEDVDIVLSVGEKSIDFLEYLKKHDFLKHKNRILAASLHQYNNKLDNLPLDYIALPEVSINTPEKKASIQHIPHHRFTFAVPNINPDINALKKDYMSWKDKLKINQDYIIIMLPGDAPDSSGKMNYFTKESAKMLFDDVYKLWQASGSSYQIIIHNGPRTGKYNPETGEIICSHQYKRGEDAAIAVDQVSQYFISLIEEKRLKYHFFNFAFEVDGETKKALSVYNQLLYLAQVPDHKNYLVIPGESVSMLGQVPLYLNSDRAIVFKSSSMNEAHQDILNLAIERGYISYFSDVGKVIHPRQGKDKLFEDDSSLIAKDLVKLIR